MGVAKGFIRQGSILDIGCGEGRLLNCINEEAPYLGLDIDGDCIEKAKKKWENRKNVEFRIVSFDEDLMLKQRFDTIVLLAIIEHLVSPEKSLNILKDYLKEDGRIIITTPKPFAGKILRLGSRFGLFDKEAQKEHKKIFGKKDLYQLAAGAGLKVDYYSTFEFGLNNIAVMVHG